MWTYCKFSWLFDSIIEPSSFAKYGIFFSKRLTLQFWSFVLNLGILLTDPALITSIVVELWLYPPPGSTILIDVKDPFSRTGTKTAPTPSPLITKFGTEIYLDPEFWMITSTILPLLIIGVTCASIPKSIETCGWKSRFIISDDPYPTPPFSKWTEVTLPLKIGSISALKVSPPIGDIPTSPIRVAVIGG